MAWSAIMAGHKSSWVLAKSPQVGRIIADRDETVLSGLGSNSPTAEEWVRRYGRNDGIEDDNLGGGTPFVCLYLFGGALGKHMLGWIVGAIPLVVSWVYLVNLSMKSNLKAGDLWLEDVAVFIIIFVFLSSRVHARTPPGFKGSKGIWVAVLLEAVLASTLSCIAHGFGLIAEGPEGLPGSRMVIRLSKYTSLLGGWSVLCGIAEHRQAAVLRKRNLGNISPRGPPKEPSWSIVEAYLKKIMDRSRDLRVTGLSVTELEILAKMLEDRSRTEVARCIRFFTRKGNTVDTFDLLLAFQRGYTNWMVSGEGSPKLLAWVKEHGLSSFKSVDSILTLTDESQSQSLPGEVARELDRIRSRQSSGDREDERAQRWCLCGAIASYLDHGVDMDFGSDNFSWYALAAAVLCENRNALAVMEARRSRIDERDDASGMWENMAKGCRQVLEKVTDDGCISSERGIVVTRARAGSKWAMFYTPAEVWRAEQGNEAVMFDAHAFSLLFGEGTSGTPLDAQPEVRSLSLLVVSEESKSEILRTSVEMASNVDAHVEFVAAMAYLRVQRRAMVNARASARRGWIIHTVWVSCAIVIHVVFPENLLYLSTFSFLATSIDRTDLQTHVVYIGFHMWRSWIGRIALWSPFANMDDTDINSVAAWAYWAAVFSVNWVGVEFGRHPGLWCRICFLVILISSTIPGFAYLFREGDTGGTDGSIRYFGRMRGSGYEHRDPDLRDGASYGPVGKNVIVKGGGAGGFTIASALRREARDVHDHETEPRDV